MAIPNHRGVFLLEGAGGEPILLATAASIRTRMRSKLTAPENPDQPTRQADLRTISSRLRWKLSDSHFETNWHYWQLSRVIYPKTYREMMNLQDAWFLQCNVDAAAPWLSRAQDVTRPGAYLGPFMTGRSAQRFLEMLEDAFDLCRCLDELRAAPHGRPCVYRQLGRCLGPCEGAISMEEYRRIVRQGCDFAAGDRLGVRREMEGRMRELAAGQHYEQAANLKARLKRLEDFDKPEYAWVAPLEKFRFLYLHPGPKRSAKVFFVDRGEMPLGGMLAWPADKPAIEQALAAARMFFPQPREMNSARQEGLSLVSHFLFYPDERAGLALRWSESLSADEVTLAMEQAKEKLKLVKSAKDSPLPGPDQS
jgi:excinuclease UvrABC nuclease subunit